MDVPFHLNRILAGFRFSFKTQHVNLGGHISRTTESKRTDTSIRWTCPMTV